MTGIHRQPLVVAGQVVEAGSRVELELRPARLPSGGWMPIPVIAIHGMTDGPTIWLSAAIHGDEVCGVEIIRQVLNGLNPANLCGTILAVPVVNIPGFANRDRYMPDRRDLNRAFPGSIRGSLASQFARIFMDEVVARCAFGIDFHTGSDHRKNLPQVRADLDDPRTLQLAKVFAAPATLHSRLRDGSLREAAVRKGIRTLLFEGGEASRFDRHTIDTGVAGTVRVLASLNMIDPLVGEGSDPETVLLRSSHWMRSPKSGIIRMEAELGETVLVGRTVAIVADAFGSSLTYIRSRSQAIVIGRNEQPVVHRGDAVIHLAPLESST